MDVRITGLRRGITGVAGPLGREPVTASFVLPLHFPQETLGAQRAPQHLPDAAWGLVKGKVWQLALCLWPMQWLEGC